MKENKIKYGKSVHREIFYVAKDWNSKQEKVKKKSHPHLLHAHTHKIVKVFKLSFRCF